MEISQKTRTKVWVEKKIFLIKLEDQYRRLNVANYRNSRMREPETTEKNHYRNNMTVSGTKEQKSPD